jgi:Transposase DDE domain
VATTSSTIPDVKMTTPINQTLAQRRLLPAEHYLDSGYPSAQTITDATALGITLVTPALLDQSPQAKAGAGFDKSAFVIDWAARQARCPLGQTSSSWSPAVQHGTKAIVVTFGATTCGPCPARAQCTTSRRGRRQLTLQPRELHEALARARAGQTTTCWRDKYAIRAGAESTIHQAIATCGIRRARYRGLPKIRLQHAFSAVAINLTRLHTWWNSPPLDHARTSHLTRLDQALAA